MNSKKPLRLSWAPTLGACLLLGCTATSRNTQPEVAVQASKPRALGVDTKNFDPSVRPQDDFFRYVNGTWLKTAAPRESAHCGRPKCWWDRPAST